jgi:hypothetical protein
MIRLIPITGQLDSWKQFTVNGRNNIDKKEISSSMYKILITPRDLVTAIKDC